MIQCVTMKLSHLMYPRGTCYGRPLLEIWDDPKSFGAVDVVFWQVSMHQRMEQGWSTSRSDEEGSELGKASLNSQK